MTIKEVPKPIVRDYFADGINYWEVTMPGVGQLARFPYHQLGHTLAKIVCTIVKFGVEYDRAQ